MNYLFDWFLNNMLEAFGMISGLVYIFLSVRQNILLWPVGIITSLIFMYIFFQSTLYADSGLQAYYFFVSLYGWYFWLKSPNKTKDSGKLKISTMKFYQWPVSILITLFLGLFLNFVFAKYTNASNPMWDGMVTAGSITATWMLARKLIEQWLLWIVVDGASIALFVVKGLYFTAFLTLVYTLMAIWGYIKWYKELKLQQTETTNQIV